MANSLIALTHKPSPLLNSCELTFLKPQKIDIAKAQLEHENYCRMLLECGAQVITLDGNLSFPDCAFVEDTAIVLDEIAVITSMGVPSRRAEIDLVRSELSRFRPTAIINPPAQLEGGDVLAVGRNLFVGLSTRTNGKGIKELIAIVKPFGYKVFAVEVCNSLHLKTGCTFLNDETVLINPKWIDAEGFKNFEQIHVPDGEPFGGNILRIGDEVCIHSGFPRTAEIIGQLGYRTKLIDISELQKAEAGLTCLSLLFRSGSR